MPIVAEKVVGPAILGMLEWDLPQLKRRLQIPDQPGGDSEQSKNLIQMEMDEIKKRKKRWQLAYGNGAFDLDELNELIRDDVEREKVLKKQLEELEDSNPATWTLEEVFEHLEGLIPLWGNIKDDVAKRDFIRVIFESVTINTDVTNAISGPGVHVPIYIQEFKLAH